MQNEFQDNPKLDAMMGSTRNYGLRLSESRRWKPFVESIPDAFRRVSTAIVLENTRQYINNMSETTRAIQIGDFQKYAFPLVRAIFPESVAQNIVSVQPMMSMTTLVFYMDFVYGSTKGTVTRGQKLFDSQGLGTNNPYYSSDLIDAETVATGSGLLATVYTLSLSYTPVKSGSVVITDGTQVATDDGNGNLVGAATAGTVNYQTGAIAGLTFASLVTTGAPIVATYNYDMEANSQIPEIDMQITSSPVFARPRKLKTKFSLESAFSLRAQHGIEAEVELTTATGADIRFEIDREIINDIRQSVPSYNLASAWSATKIFKSTDSYTTATGGSDIVGYTEHLLSLVNQFVSAGNKIFASTGRATGLSLLAA